MKLEEIDNIFKRQEHQFDRMPSANLWDKLDAQLSEKPPAKVKSLWQQYRAIAASILLVLAALSLVWLAIPSIDSEEMAMNERLKSTTEKVMDSEINEVREQEKVESIAEKTKATAPKKVEEKAEKETLPLKRSAKNKKTVLPKSIPIPKKEQAIPPPRPVAKKSIKKPDYQQSIPNNNAPKPIAKAKDNQLTTPNLPTEQPAKKTAKSPQHTWLPAKVKEADKAFVDKEAEFLAEEVETEEVIIDQRMMEISRYDVALNYPAYPPAPSPVIAEQSPSMSKKRSKAKAATNNWLTGAWIYKKDNLRLEEHWEKTGKGKWEGKTFSFVNGQRMLTELMWLSQKGEDYTYTIRDLQTNKKIKFELVEKQGNTWIFQNPTYDFPKQIIYAKISDKQVNINFSNTQAEGIINLYKN